MKSITLKKDHKHGTTQYYAGQTVVLPDEVVEFINGEFVASRAVLVAPKKEEVKEANDK